MGRFRLETPFCGRGDLRSVAIAAGCIYLLLALGGASTGFGYNPGINFNTTSSPNSVEVAWSSTGYGTYGENYLLMLLGVSSVVWMISNISLIHGAVKRRHSFILPWIYWQLVFVIIALMVLIWSSIVLVNPTILQSSDFTGLRAAMIAALCCVTPFLFTVIYSSIVVYSFYCDLKGVKRKEDMPDTSAPVRTVMPPGNSRSHRPPAIPPKTEEHRYEDLLMQTFSSNSHAMPPGSSTSHRPPAIPPNTEQHRYNDLPMQTSNVRVMLPGSSMSHRPPPIPPKTEEPIYEDMPMQNARNQLSPNAANAEQEEMYAVYAYTLPGRIPETTQFM